MVVERGREAYTEIERLYRGWEADRIEAIAWECKDSRKDAEMHVAIDIATGATYLEHIKKLLNGSPLANDQYRLLRTTRINPRTTEGLGELLRCLQHSSQGFEVEDATIVG